MQLQGSAAKKAALTLLLADVAFGDPLTTIIPCKESPNTAIHPITVTSQYQPVSTCHATTACIKGKCSTIFPFTTYPFVSTVVPCAWDGTTTQKSLVTDVTQPFRVSEHLETITTITTAPTGKGRHWIDWIGRGKPATSAITLYETVTRRAVAPFNECGSLAIPGWEGSGLCNRCDHLEDGSRGQLLDVIECRFGSDAAGKQFENCAEWYETWISRPAPTSTVTASALCSSQGKIHSAGTYTWTFPQSAPPVTITAPPRTVTITIDGRKTVTVDPKVVYTIPGRPWNAYVTKIFSGPTTFNFNVYVTKVIIFNIPNFTQPAGSTRHVPVPTGSSGKHGDGWWPLSNKDGSDSYYGGGGAQGWADWNPVTKTTTTTKKTTSTKPNTKTSSASTSASSSLGPIYPTWSTSSSSTSSASSTTTSSLSSTTSSVSTSTSSTSSSSLSLGPISQSTSTSSVSTSTSSMSTTSSSSLSLGPISQSTSTSSTSSSSLSQGPIIQSTSSSTSSSVSTLSSSTSSSLSVGPISQSTSTSSTSSVSSSLSVGPISQSTSTSSTSSTSTLSTTSSSSVSIGPITVSTSSSTSTGPSSTTSSSSTTVSSSTTSFTTTSSSTTSSAPATTTSAAPICQLNVNICLNSQGITANTIVTQSCPLGIGLLCTLNQLLGLVPQILSGNPNVRSLVIGNNEVLGLSITPQQVQAGILDGSIATVCGIVGPTSVIINDPTCPLNPVTTTSSATSTSSSTITSSASATTTTSAAPVCNLALSVCPNAPALISATITTVQCPLLGGLLCTVNQLLALVPQLLQSNPNVLSVVLGNNQILGLNLSPQQVQALALGGTLTSACSILQQVNVVVSDPTCPINPTSTTTSSAATTTTSAAGTTTTSSVVTTTTTTSAAAPAATTAAAQCGTVVQLCAGQTLQSLGLTQVSCSLGIPVLCTLVQLASDVTNACVALPGGCTSVGRIGTGLNVLGATGLVGTQSVAQIQAAIGGVQNCQPSGQFLTLSDPSCAVNGILKRRGNRAVSPRF